jgi:hypothetical protein
MTFGLGKKRPGLGIIGAAIVIIAVLVVLGWFGFYIR